MVLKQVKNTALYKWVYDGGGQVPAYLRGMYTSPSDARKGMDRYKAHLNAPSAS